ncbi:ABC transporter permease [Gemella sp. GH3]|uniref:ABC transporter permease n=1 Tax=unclassified Gemella TaxID=2624949 RepID=UPI0015CFED63|nr:MULTISPECIES: ABC transporter permease [unclassified Gemella]MBF0713673.1 ABC transporter permease [Gemella sp. GH3.1]NYS50625.1 ABC transporter permease [Gemella sp. GH3]
MNNLLTVFLFEFKQFLIKKTTIITFAIYIILAFGATFVPSLFEDNGIFSSDSTSSNNNFERSAYIVKDVDNFNIDKSYLKEAKEYSDLSTLEQDIKDGKIEEAIVFTKDGYDYLVKSNSLTGNNSQFISIFDNFVKKYIYEQNNLDYMKVQSVNVSVPKVNVVAVSGEDGVQTSSKAFSIYVLSFVLYILIIMFGSTLASNVAREKTNRAMELLVISVKPTTLILGKVLAFCSVALMQIVALLGTVFIGLKINIDNYSNVIKNVLENMDYTFIAVWLLFALTGIIMFMFLFAACGSLVSRIEEVNTVITLPMIMFIASFMANVSLMWDYDTKLFKVLSYIPFTSYFTMGTRYGLSGDLPLLEVVVSYVILLITTIIIALLSGKIYRNATLRYGQKLSFFKMMFNK